MLGEDDRGLSQMFRVDHATVPGISLEWAGWEDNEDQPRSAEEPSMPSRRPGRSLTPAWIAGA
jgi:hypothetical protein